MLVFITSERPYNYRKGDYTGRDTSLYAGPSFTKRNSHKLLCIPSEKLCSTKRQYLLFLLSEGLIKNKSSFCAVPKSFFLLSLHERHGKDGKVVLTVE